MSLLSIISSIGGSISTGGGGLPPFTPVTGVSGVVRSLGTNTYTAFPHLAGLSDGRVVMVLKESDNHAAAGDLLFGVSDGSLTYNFAAIEFGGVPLSCANLGIGVGDNDRIIISTQESDLGPIEVYYSDNEGTSWSQATQPFTYPAGYSSAQFGKIINLAGGGLLLSYYMMPLSTSDPSIAGVLKSTDNGVTWAQFGTVASRPQRNPGLSGNDNLTAGNGYTSEVYIVPLPGGTTDANTSLVALLRDEEIAGGAHIHYKSTDGGATWSRLAGTSSLFTEFMGTLANDRFPVHITTHNGTVYIFAGTRNVSDFNISYITVTPTDFLNNTGYSARTNLSYTANMPSNGSTNDFGYPEPLSRTVGSLNEILVAFYDTSPTSSGIDRDIWVYQIKIPM